MAEAASIAEELKSVAGDMQAEDDLTQQAKKRKKCKGKKDKTCRRCCRSVFSSDPRQPSKYFGCKRHYVHG